MKSENCKGQNGNCSDGRKIELQLQPEMAHEILRLLRAFRAEPFEAIPSPHLVASAMRRERELAGRTFCAIMRVLLAGQAPLLDSELLDAVEAMKDAHDRARERTEFNRRGSPSRRSALAELDAEFAALRPSLPSAPLR